MDFPIAELMDEDACHAKLLRALHPGGLTCPRCHRADRIAVHRSHRAPVLDHRCKACRRVFNAFTGSALHGSHRRPSRLILIPRGIAQGVPTAQLARELDCDRSELHGFGHRIQDLAHRDRDRMPPDDETLEADEAYRDAGEERRPPPRPGRPAATPGQQAARPRQPGE